MAPEKVEAMPPGDVTMSVAMVNAGSRVKILGFHRLSIRESDWKVFPETMGVMTFIHFHYVSLIFVFDGFGLIYGDTQLMIGYQDGSINQSTWDGVTSKDQHRVFTSSTGHLFPFSWLHRFFNQNISLMRFDDIKVKTNIKTGVAPTLASRSFIRVSAWLEVQVALQC